MFGNSVRIYNQYRSDKKEFGPVEIFIIIYRWSILFVDIVLFWIKTGLEYIRLGYRLVKPRKKRSVAGEVALVTGAGQGIGRQIAYQLGKLKATVICVDINEESNNETVKHIQDTDGVAFGYKCDVSRKEHVEELANKIQSEVGDVNILINNAGVLYCRPFVQWTPNQIEQVIQTNLMGQLWMLKTFLPRMIEMDRGVIVSLTSIAGYVGAPNMVPYAASKFAVRGMMEALYMELRQENPRHKVHTMTVAPFIVDTGMVKASKIRFPGLLNTVSAVEAAETVINEMRLRAPVVFIPGIYYYIHSICRLLPTHVQMLITDFIDTGIDINYDNFD